MDKQGRRVCGPLVMSIRCLLLHQGEDEKFTANEYIGFPIFFAYDERTMNETSREDAALR